MNAAMIVFPVAVYYFCFLFLFNKGGIIDLSDDLNNRVNYSGFAAVAAVQVYLPHVVSYLSLMSAKDFLLLSSSPPAGYLRPFLNFCFFRSSSHPM